MVNPTALQKAIFECVQNSDKHIVVPARAGSGKSTTLKGICEIFGKMPVVPDVCFLAFSSDIKKEMDKKLPSFVHLYTCHSLGNKVLRNSPFNRLIKREVNEDKYSKILGEYVQNMFFDEGQSQTDYFKAVKKLVDLGRMNFCKNEDSLQTIAVKHNIEIFGDELEVALKVISKGSQDISSIDFVDMIWLPNILRVKDRGTNEVKPLTFPQYDFVLIDEAQDLNILQQKIVRKILKPKTGRFVAVGDEYQCIYSFMGADSESFNRFTKYPNTEIKELSECFRCPKSGIRLLNKVFPEINITAYEGNIEGVVRGYDKEDGALPSLSEVKSGDLVLCTRNAPLIKACYKFMAENKPAYIRGKQFSGQLIKLIDKSRKNDLKEILKFLQRYKEKFLEVLKTSKNYLSEDQVVNSDAYQLECDKIDVLKHMIHSNGTVRNAATLKQKIRTLFSSAEQNGIILSTVHKAKGDEADNVFILHNEYFSQVREKQPWEIQQLRNLQYVAYSRHKVSLNFIPTLHEQKEPVNEIEVE